MYLRQNTAQVVKLGPFLDATDGKTEETALTITNTDVRLSKDGGNYTNSSTGSATHDELGMYDKTLSTTDTNTVGELVISVHDSATHLPVEHRYWVLEEDIFDALFGASANGFNSSGQVVVQSVITDAITSDSIEDGALTAAKFADGAISGDVIGEITFTVGSTNLSPTTCSTNLVTQGFTSKDIFKNRTIEWLSGSNLYGAVSFVHAYDEATGDLTFNLTPNSISPVSGDTARLL